MSYNWRRFWQGSVRVRVSGVQAERFLNLCLARQISLWDIRKRQQDILVTLPLRDMKNIRPLARQSRTRVRRVGQNGLYFWWRRLRQRPALSGGVLLAAVLLYYLSLHVWFIEIKGVRSLTAEQVVQAAAACGLQRGVWRDRLPLREIERKMTLLLPTAVWVGVQEQGTRLVIEVVENQLPRPLPLRAAHIVAAKAAWVKEVIVVQGQPLVKRGDMVEKGDLLIRGDGLAAEAPLQKPTLRAQGIVRAQVWYEGYGEALCREVYYTESGRRCWGLEFGVGEQRWEWTWPPGQRTDFAEAALTQKKLLDWRNQEIAVESILNIYHEQIPQERILSAAEALAEAKAAALASVQVLVPETAQILAQETTVLSKPQETIVRVRVRIETQEDIAVTRELPEE